MQHLTATSFSGFYRAADLKQIGYSDIHIGQSAYKHSADREPYIPINRNLPVTSDLPIQISDTPINFQPEAENPEFPYTGLSDPIGYSDSIIGNSDLSSTKTRPSLYLGACVCVSHKDNHVDQLSTKFTRSKTH